MSKGLSGLLAVLLVTGSSLAYAQTATRAIPSQADINTRMDMRLAIAKDALALTPDQQKLWPPVESAIRARAEDRRGRIAKIQNLEHRPEAWCRG